MLLGTSATGQLARESHLEASATYAAGFTGRGMGVTAILER